MVKRFSIAALAAAMSISALLGGFTITAQADELTQIQDPQAVYYGNHGADFTAEDISLLQSIFDPVFYAESNPDVLAAIKNNLGDSYSDEELAQLLFKHFYTYGMFEGRSVSSEFNATAFASAYSDLKELFGTNLLLYYKYAATHDLAAEGRTITTVEKAAEAGITVTSIANEDVKITPALYYAAEKLGVTNLQILYNATITGTYNYNGNNVKATVNTVNNSSTGADKASSDTSSKSDSTSSSSSGENTSSDTSSKGDSTGSGNSTDNSSSENASSDSTTEDVAAVITVDTLTDKQKEIIGIIFSADGLHTTDKVYTSADINKMTGTEIIDTFNVSYTDWPIDDEDGVRTYYKVVNDNIITLSSPDPWYEFENSEIVWVKDEAGIVSNSVYAADLAASDAYRKSGSVRYVNNSSVQLPDVVNSQSLYKYLQENNVSTTKDLVELIGLSGYEEDKTFYTDNNTYYYSNYYSDSNQQTVLHYTYNWVRSMVVFFDSDDGINFSYSYEDVAPTNTGSGSSTDATNETNQTEAQTPAEPTTGQEGGTGSGTTGGSTDSNSTGGNVGDSGTQEGNDSDEETPGVSDNDNDN